MLAYIAAWRSWRSNAAPDPEDPTFQETNDGEESCEEGEEGWQEDREEAQEGRQEGLTALNLIVSEFLQLRRLF